MRPQSTLPYISARSKGILEWQVALSRTAMLKAAVNGPESESGGLPGPEPNALEGHQETFTITSARAPMGIRRTCSDHVHSRPDPPVSSEGITVRQSAWGAAGKLI